MQNILSLTLTEFSIEYIRKFSDEKKNVALDHRIHTFYPLFTTENVAQTTYFLP